MKAFENLFSKKNVEVAVDDGYRAPDTPRERGGILAWRLLRGSVNFPGNYYYSLLTDELWTNDNWHEAHCIVADNVAATMSLVSSSNLMFTVQNSPLREQHDGPCPHTKTWACGFHSYNSYSHAFYTAFTEVHTIPHVIAPVIIAGRVIEFEDGWKSSRMRLLDTQLVHVLKPDEAEIQPLIARAIGQADALGARVSPADRRRIQDV